MKFIQKTKKEKIGPLKISFILALVIHLFIIIFLSNQISFNDNNQQEKKPTFKIIYIGDVVYNTPQMNIQTAETSMTQEEENLTPKNTGYKEVTDIEDNNNTTYNDTNTTNITKITKDNNNDSDLNNDHLSIDGDEDRVVLDKDTSKNKPLVVNNSSATKEANELSVGEDVNNNNIIDDSDVEISDKAKDEITGLDYQAESIDTKTNNIEKEIDIKVNSDDFDIKKSEIDYKSNINYVSNLLGNQVITSGKDDIIDNNAGNNDLEKKENTKVDEELINEINSLVTNEEESETVISNISNEAVSSDVDNKENKTEKSKVDNTVEKKDENKVNKEADDDILIIDLTQNTSIDNLTPPTVSNIEQPVYPKEMKKREIEGEVILKLLINEKGKVDQVEIYNSSGFEQFDIEAEKVAKGWQFTPTTKDGTNVMAWILVPIKFKLY